LDINCNLEKCIYMRQLLTFEIMKRILTRTLPTIPLHSFFYKLVSLGKNPFTLNAKHAQSTKCNNRSLSTEAIFYHAIKSRRNVLSYNLLLGKAEMFPREQCTIVIIGLINVSLVYLFRHVQ